MPLATEGFSAYVWNNQLKSILLLLGFPVLLVLLLAGFFFCVDLADINQPANVQHALGAAFMGVDRYGPYAVLAAGAWFVIAYFFHGGMMRAATGARPVTRAEMPKIYNMLENLCISRGMAIPAFEIIDSPALNAFATGIDEKSYRIVLTRGIVEALPDDELEAVIAHELTHIINRDCRLLVISVIFVGMISFLCHFLYRTLIYGGRVNYYTPRTSREREGAGGGGSNGMLLIIIGMIVLAIGYLFALILRFALSRRREYLADAGSVELTKNPGGMMRALMRISGKDVIPGMPDNVEQLCIENSHRFMGLFSTHPAIEDRIDAIRRTTGEPVPEPTVTLRRSPKQPWGGAIPPQNTAAPLQNISAASPHRGPWDRARQTAGENDYSEGPLGQNQPAEPKE